jgi:hypothetical protein
MKSYAQGQPKKAFLATDNTDKSWTKTISHRVHPSEIENQQHFTGQAEDAENTYFVIATGGSADLMQRPPFGGRGEGPAMKYMLGAVAHPGRRPERL